MNYIDELKDIASHQSDFNNIVDAVITTPKIDLSGRESKTVILKSRQNNKSFYKFANDLELK